ncbi:hypothetical protein RND81_11G059000 [Saponaria officinalis]|uniref:Uncharacterized protein n=1 Tax=Saponaria officinalis TaxID=3572 RepID=A0AAW1HK04_SAPOF
MASPPTMSLFFFSFLFMLLATEGSDIIRMKESSEIREKHLKEDLKPTVWPEQFHSLLVMSNAKTMEMQVANLWYDWPNKRNLHIIQYQLGKKLYDAEYDNHTSFFFTRDDTRECRTAEVEVGILTPNWLHGATYLGQQQVDGGFLCNVWEKVEFIWYYEDVVSKRPVQWIFYTGILYYFPFFLFIPVPSPSPRISKDMFSSSSARPCSLRLKLSDLKSEIF